MYQDQFFFSDLVEKELIAQDALSLSRLLNETRVHKFKCAVHILRLLLSPLRKQERIDKDVLDTVLNKFQTVSHFLL